MRLAKEDEVETLITPRARALSSGQEATMLKFLGSTIGVIFLIGLVVVILVLMLIF